MSTVLAVLGVAFAAFAIWLTVRIVNRRERWAKRTAVMVLAAAGYPLSFGPFLWLFRRGFVLEWLETAVGYFYLPILWADWLGPRWLQAAIDAYAHLWVP